MQKPVSEGISKMEDMAYIDTKDLILFSVISEQSGYEQICSLLNKAKAAERNSITFLLYTGNSCGF